MIRTLKGNKKLFELPNVQIIRCYLQCKVSSREKADVQVIGVLELSDVRITELQLYLFMNLPFLKIADVVSHPAHA